MKTTLSFDNIQRQCNLLVNTSCLTIMNFYSLTSLWLLLIYIWKITSKRLVWQRLVNYSSCQRDYNFFLICAISLTFQYSLVTKNLILQWTLQKNKSISLKAIRLNNKTFLRIILETVWTAKPKCGRNSLATKKLFTWS